MTRLLVSVRSPDEAEAAVIGGAAVIDVKEPANGSLGRATDRRIAEIVRRVAGRRPVSAALGDWSEPEGVRPAVKGLRYLKWGFYRQGYAHRAALAAAATEWARIRAERPACGLVTVAYADCLTADAPTPEVLCRFACAGRWGPFALDTWNKDGSTLLDHLPLTKIAALIERCRAAGVPVALAGSLGRDEMETLLPLAPDWFAVRTAVCGGGDRQAEVDGDEVRLLVEWLAESQRQNPTHEG
jgi:uncharacterized protein (UPF0264 family)